MSGKKVTEKGSKVKNPVGAPVLYNEIRRTTISMEQSTFDEMVALPNGGERLFSTQANEAFFLYLDAYNNLAELSDIGDGSAAKGIEVLLDCYHRQ